MRYEIEFSGYKRHGYISERRRGLIACADVHEAQRLMRDIPELMRRFDADAGEITLWDERDWPLFGVTWDVERVCNRLPIAYREFVSAIYAA